jgi:DNA-binding GntR family transcriptional regulator
MTNQQKNNGDPPKVQNLTKAAYKDIRRMLFLNELRPGQKVVYRKMAERLNMSLTPVVQALKQMEFMGLVRHEPNQGFFVEQISLQDVEEAYELREILELSLLPDVINNLDGNGEKKLKQALDEYFKTSHGPVKLRMAKDIKFHLTMAQLSGQRLTVWILRYLFDFLYLRFDQDLTSYRPQDKAGQEHQAIFDGVIARDVSVSHKALQRHIQNIRNGMLKGMRNRLVDIEQFDF